MISFTAKPTFAEGERGKTRLAACLAAYIVGVLAAFGLIRLANEPDWLSAVSIVSSLVSGVVTSTIQKKLDTMSVPLGRIVTAILAGIVTVVLLTLVSYWHAQHTDIDARGYITASGNTNIDPGQSALFSIDVPSHRDYLTVKFAGTPSLGDDENCINGASLILVQIYGATVSHSSTIDFGSDYRVRIPSGVVRFALSVTFVPQWGFEVCASDVTVTSAHFHN
jgi:hypothetical protein